MIIFDDQILETGLVFEIDGLGLNVSSNGGKLGNFTSEPFEGIWIGQTSDTNSIYTFKFSQPVSCLNFSFDAANSISIPVETFSDFAISLGGGLSEAVEIGLSEANGVSLSGSSVVTNPSINQTAGAGGTISYSGKLFDSFSFRFSQDGANNGSVIERIEVEITDLELKTAAQIFKAEGKLAFLAKMSMAAYNLLDREIIADRTNDVKISAKGWYDYIDQKLQLLNACDLPDLEIKDSMTGTGGVNTKFPKHGIENGIYTNGNAAALVARSKDALFITFRGTNDNEGEAGFPFDTPDEDHWIGKGDHFALFTDLINALSDYLEQPNIGIKKIFVNGHSLGASMVEAFMDLTNDPKTFGTLFASPGYGGGLFSDDKRMSNLWIDKDPILDASWTADNEGDENTILHNLEDGDYLHSMDLYIAFVDFMQKNGIDQQQISSKALHNIDYDKIYINATTNASKTAFQIGKEDDYIKGSRKADIILGGDGLDVLEGGKGRDHIDGGAQADIIYGGKYGDFIFGRGGADTLIGQKGKDYLEGGIGKDTFVFQSRKDLSNIKKFTDTIGDFNYRDAADIMDFSLIDADKTLDGDQSFTFLKNAVFSGTAGELRFLQKAGNTIVKADLDGSGTSNFTLVLTGIHNLEASDFIL